MGLEKRLIRVSWIIAILVSWEIWLAHIGSESLAVVGDHHDNGHHGTIDRVSGAMTTRDGKDVLVRQKRETCVRKGSCSYCKENAESGGEIEQYDYVWCFLFSGSNVSSALYDIPPVKHILLRCFSSERQDMNGGMFDKHASTLQHLQIMFCRIGALPPSTFSGLVDLQHLELSYAELNEEHLPAIGGIYAPASVKLVGNDIHLLGSGTFGNGSSNITVLDLSYNALQRVENYSFVGFPSLQRLLLGNNNISVVEENSFIGLRLLSNLNMRDNPYLLMPANGCALQNLPHLTVLDISSTGLTNLSEVTCAPLPRLKQFLLQGNRLQQIPRASFQNTPGLLSLDVSNNSINSLHGAAFSGLTNMTEMNLTMNRIVELNAYHFYYTPSIINVNVSHNRLTLLRIGTFSGLSNLETIALSFNHIQSIEYQAIVKVDRLRYIDLRNNNFITYPNSLVIFIGFIQPPHIRMNVLMAGNPFSCGCDTMFSIRTGVFAEDFPALAMSDNSTWDCAEPPPAENSRMMSVPRLNFWCPYRGVVCPESCECYKRDIDKAHLLFCLYAERTNLPAIPAKTAIFNCTHCLSEDIGILTPNDLVNEQNLEELVLTDVGIGTIEPSSLSELVSLQRLDFSRNSLMVIDELFLPSSENLRTLDLSHNQILEIAQNALEANPSIAIIKLHSNSLETITDGVFNYTTSLQSVTLHDNPFVCNCSLFWLKQWLQSNLDRVEDIYQVTCYVNSTVDMLPIIQVDDRDFGCYDPEVHFLTTQQYTAVIVTSILTSIFLLVFTVSFRHRRAIRVILYTRYGFHLLHDDDDTAGEEQRWEYDAYVAYSDDDFEFVLQQLLPILEDDPPHYKLCMRHRDFAPGGCLATTIVNSLESSRRSIVLLSRSYLQDEWRLLEFKTAHQRVLQEKRNKNLILVFLEDVKKDELDDDMKNYITANAFLTQRDRLFREKLVFEMPKNPLGRQHQEDNINRENEQ